jgi:hypothetical protein
MCRHVLELDSTYLFSLFFFLHARTRLEVRGCVGAWVRGCVGAWVRACVGVGVGAGLGVGVGGGVGVGVRACVRACVRAWLRACVRGWLRACVRACVPHFHIDKVSHQCFTLTLLVTRRTFFIASWKVALTKSRTNVLH